MQEADIAFRLSKFIYEKREERYKNTDLVLKEKEQNIILIYFNRALSALNVLLVKVGRLDNAMWA